MTTLVYCQSGTIFYLNGFYVFAYINITNCLKLKLFSIIFSIIHLRYSKIIYISLTQKLWKAADDFSDAINKTNLVHIPTLWQKRGNDSLAKVYQITWHVYDFIKTKKPGKICTLSKNFTRVVFKVLHAMIIHASPAIFSYRRSPTYTICTNADPLYG